MTTSQRSDPPRSKRSLSASAALLIASVSLCVLVLELLLAKFAPDVRPYSEVFRGPRMPFAASTYLPATTPKSLTFHHETPEFDVSYRFNEHGYRGPNPMRIEKPAGSRRIVVLGDSFALGWGSDLEDTFVQKIWEDLRDDGFEVINAGYRGYITPDAYYAFLVTEGLALEPDMAIVVLFSGNDITEMRDNMWFSLDERGMPLQLGTTRLYTDHDGDFLFPLGSREQLVRWNYEIPVLRESRTFIGVSQLLDRAFSGEPAYQRRYTLMGKLREPQPASEGWRRFALSIESLNALCRERGVKIVYALIPPSADRWKEDSDRTLDRMRAVVTRSGAPLMDPQPHLKPEHYYPEGHFNATGNEVFAERMIAFLRGTPDILAANGTDRSE